MADEKKQKQSRRAKGEGSLLKIKGCRFWYAQYYDQNGKQRRVSTRTETKKEALGTLRRVMGDRDRGLAPISDARKITYGNLRAALLANYQEKGNKSLETRPDGTETIVGLPQLDTFFGYTAESEGCKVADINTDVARAFTKQRRAEGAGTSIINRSLACLRRMLNIAHEDGKIQFVPKIHMLKEPEARKGFLELAKFEELLALLPGHLRPLILFLYWCGVRKGEALQIEWSQVDLELRLITLDGEQTKSKEPRIVPLPAILVTLLSEIMPKVGRVFSDTNLRMEWETACAAVGLGTRQELKSASGYKWHKYTGLIVHDLRRSAVRNLRRAGVPETVAMKISGHKTADVFRRYNITSTDDLTEAMRNLETASLVSARLVKTRQAATAEEASKVLKAKATGL